MSRAQIIQAVKGTPISFKMSASVCTLIHVMEDQMPSRTSFWMASSLGQISISMICHII